LVFENAEEIFNLVGLTPSAATRSRPGEYNSVTAVWMTSSNASTTRSDLWMSLSRPLPYPRHAVFLKTLETVLLTKKGCARFCALSRYKTIADGSSTMSGRIACKDAAIQHNSEA